MYFLFCFSLLQILLVYYFYCGHFPRIHACHLETFGEPSLPKKPTPGISPDCLPFIFIRKAFLDDGAIFGMLGGLELLLFFLYNVSHFRINNIFHPIIL